MTEPSVRQVRLLVAEDNEVMRLGMVTLLETQDDMKVVAEAANGADALRLYRSTRPDLLIADLVMPVMDGVELTAAVRREDPKARVLIFTHHATEADLRRALAAGAMGYLGKEGSSVELVTAVRAVARGETFVPADLSRRLAVGLLRKPPSARELQVLRLLAHGLTNAAIASTLGLAERTVAMYVGKLLDKLDAKTRTEAVSRARERGFLKTGPGGH